MTRKVSELASNARLEVFTGSLAGKVFDLEGEVVIGRRDEGAAHSAIPDISLPDSRVSRRHARLFVKNGHYFLEDLNSTNGTFLNAFNVVEQEPARMRKGNNVQVGETLMKFYPEIRAETGNENKRDSSPWQSEIGLNEQNFDISKSPNENENENK
jgi:pSer/pThr/pTyr-binding forkhead associated (FHA) protein